MCLSSLVAVIFGYGPMYDIQTRLGPNHWLSKAVNCMLPALMRDIPPDWTNESKVPNLFDRDQFIVWTTGKVALLMMYGVVFPPLAVPIYIGILTVSLITAW
jgi:hypothetical protein